MPHICTILLRICTILLHICAIALYIVSLITWFKLNLLPDYVVNRQAAAGGCGRCQPDYLQETRTITARTHLLFFPREHEAEKGFSPTDDQSTTHQSTNSPMTDDRSTSYLLSFFPLLF